jgi:hypothetical protein
MAAIVAVPLQQFWESLELHGLGEVELCGTGLQSYGKCRLTNGTIFVSRTPPYESALTLPSNMTRSVLTSSWIAPHTCRYPPPLATVVITQFSWTLAMFPSHLDSAIHSMKLKAGLTRDQHISPVTLLSVPVVLFPLTTL